MAQPERGPDGDVSAGAPPAHPEPAGESFSAVSRWLADREARPTWRKRWATFLVRIHWPLMRAGLASVGRALLGSILRWPRRWAAGAGGGLGGAALMCLMWAWPGAATTPHDGDFVGLERVRTHEVAPTLPNEGDRLATRAPTATPSPATTPTIDPQPQVPLITPEPPVVYSPDPLSPFYRLEDTRPAGGAVRQAGFASSDSASSSSIPAAWLTGAIEIIDDAPASFVQPPSYDAADVGPPAYDAARVGATGTDTGFIPVQYDEAHSPETGTRRSVPSQPTFGDTGPVIEPRPADRQPFFDAPR